MLCSNEQCESQATVAVHQPPFARVRIRSWEEIYGGGRGLLLV
jgi:hypothetical protein